MILFKAGAEALTYLEQHRPAIGRDGGCELVRFACGHVGLEMHGSATASRYWEPASIGRSEMCPACARQRALAA